MLTGRLLLMLVVMTATLATRPPAALRVAEGAPVERATWVQRLGSGVARSFSRIGLMQRVALRVPAPRPAAATRVLSRAPSAAIDPLRACLPPPFA